VTNRAKNQSALPSIHRLAVLNAAANVAATVVLLAGIPAALILSFGMPIPNSAEFSFTSTRALLDLLILIVWVSWLGCSVPLICSVGRRVWRRDLSTALRPGVCDRLGVRLASSILALGSGSSMLGAVLVRPPIASMRGHSVAEVTAQLEGRVPSRGVDLRPTRDVHVVRPGETLSSIARAAYDDVGEWELIAKTNLGRTVALDTRFLDPNDLAVGWRLFLPDLHSSDDVLSARPSDASQASRVVGGEKPHRSAQDDAYRTSDGKTPRSESTPEWCALGLGALGATALARRLKARRSNRLSTAEIEVADADTVDKATLVERFQNGPILRCVEVANLQLGSAIAALDPQTILPGCQLVRVNSEGITFFLTSRTSWAPRGWTLHDEGSSWWLPSSTADDSSVNHEPWIPLLIPVGSNNDGTWLIGIAPGTRASVLGPGAHDLLATMRLALRGWIWSERVIITDEPSVATSAGRSKLSGGAGRQFVLYLGDPQLLDSESEGTCGVLTTRSDIATEVTVVVDNRSATLHPSGITLKANGLDAASAESLDRLANGNSALPSVLSIHDEIQPLKHQNSVDPPLVRLLTSVPRIDGLKEPISPKRARRATELVAYLALHQPDPVTSDRLRTRVLGSQESDAAAKTLFNTVGAARRAMGSDASGALYLPIATKSGHYRLSEAVRVDVADSIALCEIANRSDSADESIALYRSALDLIEGEPLSGALSGYSWWRAEGYEAKVAVILVDAACHLAELAIGHQWFELARWSLERGRMIDPYSELLSRRAMELAASSGDVTRLRREWLECQRLVDELDPGCRPSESTTRLFAELSDRLSILSG
jgi:DNA-binding SARP family transcriptional activator